MEWFRIFLILTVFVLSSCNNSSHLEKIWISKEWTQKLGAKELEDFELKFLKENDNSKERFKEIVDDLYTSDIADKLVLNIFDDSLEWIHFNHTLYNGFTKHKLKYLVRNDSLALLRDMVGEPIYKIEVLKSNELILSNYFDGSHLPRNEIAFYPITKFSPEVEIEYIKSMINNGDFRIGTSVFIIHFDNSSKYCGRISIKNPDIILDVDTDDNWCVSKIESEILLQIGTEVIQIISVRGNVIEGLIHGATNKKILLYKI